MEEKKEDGKCGRGGCGIHCGCCVCKMVKAGVILVIGAAIGYAFGQCRSRRMCSVYSESHMQMESVPMDAATLKKAK